MTLRCRPMATVCAALFLLAGCAHFSSGPSGPRGQMISSKEVIIFPLLCAEKDVYENGVQEDGNFLLFISWSKWTDRPYNAVCACECDAAAPCEDCPLRTEAASADDSATAAPEQPGLK